MSRSGIDWAVLEQLALDYDRELADHLVELYVGELPSRVEAIVLGAAGESVVLRDAAHALVSASLIMGARRLGELCRDLERDGSDPARARSVVPALVVEAEVVLSCLSGRRSDPVPEESRYAGSNR
jgi:HPt (histidine-containing phosphotransfer) domain-containing protein